jgi:hypothetical protein
MRMPVAAGSRAPVGTGSDVTSPEYARATLLQGERYPVTG